MHITAGWKAGTASPSLTTMARVCSRYHHAVLLAPFLCEYRSILRMLFLPPYIPQLAPIERVWKLARRIATHNWYFTTLTEVLDAVGTCFDR